MILNENQVLLEAAITDTAVVNIAGLSTYSLTTANGAVDQARPLVQSYTGALTGNCTVTLPNVPKIGYAQNLTTGGFNVILTTGVGTTATIPPDGSWYLFSADGATNVILVPVGFGVLPTLTISGLLTVGSAKVGGAMVAGEISSQGTVVVGALTAGSLLVTNTVGIFAASGSNTGNGTIGSLGALTGVRTGTYTVTMGSATAFTVVDPQSVSVGSGVVGTLFATQVEFTLTAGSKAFVAGDTFDIAIQTATVLGLGAASGSNTGDGTIAAITLLTGYRIGTYVATFSSATAFIVTDPLGNTLGSGTTGVAFTTQVEFTITVGSTAFVAGDLFDIAVEPSTRIEGNLNVAGSQGIGGNLSVVGGQTIGGNLNVAGAQTIGGNLNVAGAQTVTGDLDVTGVVVAAPGVGGNDVVNLSQFILDGNNPGSLNVPVTGVSTGVLIQMGFTTTTTAGVLVTFANPFPTGLLSIVVSGSSTVPVIATFQGQSQTGAFLQAWDLTGAQVAAAVSWIAIGY